MAQKRKIPTVRLRRLAAELRRLRADAGLTREEVTDRTAITATTLYRVEHAQTRPQKRTLIGLLNLYDVQGTQRDELLAMAQQANELGWLRPYHSELPDEYTSYISFEREAWELRNAESLYVPGLLQTEGYARAAIRGGLPMATDDEVESRVQARIERQAVLSKEEPLRLRAVMDEAALHRVVGGREVMHAQMERLAEAMQLPHVRLQVMPFEAGAHPGMSGAFVLMSFADREAPEIIYVDNMAGDLFLESEVEVRRYSGMFDQLTAQALSPAETARLITTLCDKLK